jgi:hypothetical protein
MNLPKLDDGRRIQKILDELSFKTASSKESKTLSKTTSPDKLSKVNGQPFSIDNSAKDLFIKHIEEVVKVIVY